MADERPQSEDGEQKTSASSSPQDQHYSILTKVIEDVSKDHALLRKLVYALAWHSLNPRKAEEAQPSQAPQQHIKSILELERVMELGRAIERVESHDWTRPPEPANGPAQAPHNGHANPHETAPAQSSPSESDDTFGKRHYEELLEEVAALKAESTAPADPQEILKPIPSNAAIATLADPPRAWPERGENSLQRIPSWLDPNIRVSLDSVEYAPIERGSSRSEEHTSELQSHS